jgi:hypothetical protein
VTAKLRPVAMQQTLELIDQARGTLGQDDPLQVLGYGRVTYWPRNACAEGVSRR